MLGLLTLFTRIIFENEGRTLHIVRLPFQRRSNQWVLNEVHNGRFNLSLSRFMGPLCMQKIPFFKTFVFPREKKIILIVFSQLILHSSSTTHTRFDYQKSHDSPIKIYKDIVRVNSTTYFSCFPIFINVKVITDKIFFGRRRYRCGGTCTD